MIEQNNPGNLRPLPDGQVWRGQTGVVMQPNGEALCVFDAPVNGIRALGLNLLAYWSAGYRTCRTISAHWAPAGDGNDPDAYANAVAFLLGTTIDAVQSLDTLPGLVAYGKAVSIVENGHPVAPATSWYSDADWAKGMWAAIGYRNGAAPPLCRLPAPMPRHAPAPPAPPATSSRPDNSSDALNEAELANVEAGDGT